MSARATPMSVYRKWRTVIGRYGRTLIRAFVMTPNCP